MPNFGIGGTCIGDQGNQITEVTCITHCRADTLVGQKPTDDKEFDTEIAQDIVNVGRNKYARRGLREDDFVIQWFDLIKNLSIPGTFGHVKARYFIIQAAVPPVFGQAFNYGIHDLDAF